MQHGRARTLIVLAYILLPVPLFVTNQIDLKQNKAQSARAQTIHRRVNFEDVNSEDVPLVEFTHARPVRINRSRLGPLLLYLCDVCRALINETEFRN